MSVSRIFSRVSNYVSLRSLLRQTPSKNQFSYELSCNEFRNKLHASQVPILNTWMLRSSASLRLGFSSSAEPNEKDQGWTLQNFNDGISGEEKAGSETKEGGISFDTKSTRRKSRRTAFSDSDAESIDDLAYDDLVKLVVQKEENLKIKSKEIEQMKDQVLHAYAEMENVMDRNKREAENSKKFAIQNFAKGLLDVADNLKRASSVVKENFSKIDASKDTKGVAPLLKTLLEGVEMTEKQLAEVFRKFGVEKFDPQDKPFDPNLHNAVFQVPDSSRPAGTVAHVLKPGYMLYNRVIRPAEVGVTQAAGNE